MQDALNPLTAFYPEIRARISASACGWPGFEEQIARHLTRTHLPLPLILPLASAAAAGGDPRRALPVAAACAFLAVSLRWFDDVQDGDREESLGREIGAGRATNLAAAALTAAWKTLADDAEPSPTALRAFGEQTLELARGQDRDLLTGAVPTLDGYWQLMRGKTGAAIALACRVGVLSARPDDVESATACGRFGSHLGTAMQILDDLDGAFHPDGCGDLAASKVTLPVLYGLATAHQAREELAVVVAAGRLGKEAGRVRAILESLDTREFLVWAALDERRQGLTHLDALPPAATPTAEAGRDALAAFADAVLAGWEDLLERPEGAAASEAARAHSVPPSRLWPVATPQVVSGVQPGYFGRKEW